MNANIFRILAAVIFVAGVGISSYYRRKADLDSGEKVSWKSEGLMMILTLRLGGLVMWGSILAYLLNPDWMSWSKMELPDWMRWSGVGLGFTTIILIYWLFSSLGMGVTPTVETRLEHKLVTSGPYRWVRHPLYSVGAAFVGALGLIADNWFILGMAGVSLVLLAVRLPNEEAHLIEKFGNEYRQYMKTTGKFFPKLIRR